MLNQIISNYLSENKRLVIPDFGTLVRKDDKHIVFVELLKKDDGILRSLVSDQYGCSDAESVTIIRQFTDDLKRSIAHNGSYQINGVGIFAANPNGPIYIEHAATPAAYNENNGSSHTKHHTATDDVTTGAPSASGAQSGRVANNIDHASAQSAKPSVSISAHDNPAITKPIAATSATPVVAKSRKGPDLILIVAIIAAIIALASIIFGLFVDKNPMDMLRPTQSVETTLDATQTHEMDSVQ